jgi:hypothetical protein
MQAARRKRAKARFVHCAQAKESARVSQLEHCRGSKRVARVAKSAKLELPDLTLPGFTGVKNVE